MSAPHGPNVLAQYLDNGNAFLDWFERLKPGAALIMDGRDLAQSAKLRSPKTLVIHRDYNPNDMHWHDRDARGEWVFPPETWLNQHTVTGVAIAVFNEPSPGDVEKFIDWLIELMALAYARGITLVVCNFGVGNPHDKDITAGKYDRLIRAIVQYKMWLGLHEYFQDNPLTEFPWLCGRLTFWLDRAEVLGLKLNIVITEHGRDLGGGPKDGWNDQPWGQLGYYTRLVMAQTIYRKYGVAVCIFGYGYGAGNGWISFDFQRALTLLDLLVTYGIQNPMTIPAPAPPAAPYDISKLGKGISGRVFSTRDTTANIRRQPNTTADIVGAVTVNQGVTYRPVQTEILDGYTWTYLEAPVSGFVASVAVFAPSGPEITLARLDLPFTSQIDTNSSSFADDCGPAAVNMLIRMYWLAGGMLDPKFITVNDMSRHTKLAAGALGLFPEDLALLAGGYGLRMIVRKDLTQANMTEIIVRGKAIILLVNYQHVNPARKTPLGHYIALFGVTNMGNFMFHDPYLLQANHVITPAQLHLAMTDTSSFAAPNQGVILA